MYSSALGAERKANIGKLLHGESLDKAPKAKPPLLLGEGACFAHVVAMSSNLFEPASSLLLKSADESIRLLSSVLYDSARWKSLETKAVRPVVVRRHCCSGCVWRPNEVVSSSSRVRR